MKKIFVSLASLMLAIVVLAGCTGGGKTELKTMSMFGGTDPHKATYKALIEEFKKEHEVNVTDNSAVSDEIWKSSVISSFYSGTEPDVLFYFNGSIAKPLIDNEKVVSVAEIRKVYPDYAKNISPSVLDPYAVPLKGFVEGLFLNTELFTGDLATYAQKDRWTWAEFLEVCTKLAATGKTPVALGATDVPHYWIEHLILNVCGPNAFVNIPKEAAFADDTNQDAQSWVKALGLMKNLADANVFGPTKGAQLHPEAEELFRTGAAGMIVDGSWFAGGFTESTAVKANKLKMIPFPAVPTNLGGLNKFYMQSGFTSGFYISQKAWDNPEKRDLAVKFVEKMTNSSAIKTFVEATSGIPADPSVQIANLNEIQKSMNTMPSRTDGSTLPLSDAAKAGSFATLVQASNAYLTNNVVSIKAALAAFAAKQ